MTSEELRERLDAAGVTQAALAGALGVRPETVSRRLAGVGEVPPEYVAGWYVLTGRALASLRVEELVSVRQILGERVATLAAVERHGLSVGGLADDLFTWGLLLDRQAALSLVEAWADDAETWATISGIAALHGSLGVKDLVASWLNGAP